VTEKDFDVQAFARDINELLVLSTLRAGAKHGYQIGLDVETESNGLFRFRHGTRRKVYSLTGTGERHLSGETNRVQEIVSRLMHFLRHPGEAPA